MLFLDGFFFTQSQRQFLDTWVKKVFPKSLYGEDYETQLWNGCSYLLHMQQGRTIKAYYRLLTTHWNNYYYLGLTHNFYEWAVIQSTIFLSFLLWYTISSSYLMLKYLPNARLTMMCIPFLRARGICISKRQFEYSTGWQQTVFNYCFFFCRILNCNEITLPKVFRDTNL